MLIVSPLPWGAKFIVERHAGWVFHIEEVMPVPFVRFAQDCVRKISICCSMAVEARELSSAAAACLPLCSTMAYMPRNETDKIPTEKMTSRRVKAPDFLCKATEVLIGRNGNWGTSVGPPIRIFCRPIGGVLTWEKATWREALPGAKARPVPTTPVGCLNSLTSSAIDH